MLQILDFILSKFSKISLIIVEKIINTIIYILNIFRTSFYLNKAEKNIKEENYELGIKNLEKAARYVDNNSTGERYYIIHYKTGKCYFHLAQKKNDIESYKKAKNHFEKAIIKFSYYDKSEYKKLNKFLMNIKDNIFKYEYKQYNFDSTKIRNSIDNIKEALEGYKFDSSDKLQALIYAEIQSNLATCYTKELENENNNDYIKKVLLAYHECLRVYSPSEYTEKYLNNIEKLGVFYINNMSSNQDNLSTAINHLNNALHIYLSNFKAYEREVSRINYYLGKAFYKMGKIENSKDNYNKAIECLKLANNDSVKKEESEKLAQILDLKGLCYMKLFKLIDNKANLEKSNKSYEEVLSIYQSGKSDDKLLRLCYVRCHIGLNYLNLAKIENVQINLDNALNKYMQAFNDYENIIKNTNENRLLEINKKDKIKYEACYHRSRIYLFKAEVKDTKENIGYALEDIEESKKSIPSKVEPEFICKLSSVRAKALTIKSELVDRGKNLELANENISCSIDNINKEKNPIYYSNFMNRKGDIFIELSHIRKKNKQLKTAEEAYEEALSIKTLEKYPIGNAITHKKLVNLFIEKAKIKNTQENLDEACKHIKNANVFCSKIVNLPYELGKIYVHCGQIQHLFSKIKKNYNGYSNASEASFNKALDIFTSENFPIWHTKIEYQLCDLKITIVKIDYIKNKENKLDKEILIDTIFKLEDILKIMKDQGYIYKQAKICSKLADCYLMLASDDIIGDKESKHLESAENYLNETQNIFKPDSSPLDYSDLANRLGYLSYLKYLEHSNNENLFNEAEKYYKEALDKRPFKDYPIHQAYILENMGDLYLEKASKVESSEGSQRYKDNAKDCYEKAMSVFISENYVHDIENLRTKLEKAYLHDILINDELRSSSINDVLTSKDLTSKYIDDILKNDKLKDLIEKEINRSESAIQLKNQGDK